MLCVAKGRNSIGDDKCIIFLNIRKQALKAQEQAGKAFDVDETLHEKDVIAVHGQLTKEQKAAYIWCFLDPTHDDDKVIKVVCATNVGIDSKDIRSVYRLEFPHSILVDMVQKMGRAGRVEIPRME